MATVHSRAYLLIEQQLVKFYANPPTGIEVYPTYAGNLFNLSAKVHGQSGTIWDRAVLKLRLRFSEDFNYAPPEACFITVPFHPNVDPDTGRVANPLLDDPQKWNASITIGQLLANIQQLLANPSAQLILNEEANHILQNDYDRYCSIVQHCVVMSQAADDPTEELIQQNDHQQQQQQQQPPKVTIEYDEQYLQQQQQQQQQPTVTISHKRINFESYHAEWAAMATSNPIPIGRFRPETQWTEPEVYATKLNDYRRIKYGSAVTNGNKHYNKSNDNDNNKASVKEQNLQRVDRMRRLYLSQRHASNLSQRTIAINEASINSANDYQPPLDDAEVDELLNWTQELPAAHEAAAIDVGE